MIILVDIDGTIEDLLSPWLDELNKLYNKSISFSEVSEWNFEALYNISKTDLTKVLNNNKVWKKVKPIPGAIEYLKKLQQDGHSVYLVTSADYRTVYNKFVYVIHKWFSFIPDDDIIICHKKQLIKGDILIDDNPDNLIGGDYIKILFTSPHNKNYTNDNLLYRVNSWEECYSLIAKFNNNGKN